MDHWKVCQVKSGGIPRFLILFSRLFLGGVFVYASIDKVLHPAAFAEVIYNYQIVPEIFINLVALILPWLEALIGIES